MNTATLGKLLSIIYILDILVGIAKSNLILIAGYIGLIDNFGAILPLVPIFLPKTAPEVTTIEHLIAIWICVYTTRKLSNQAAYFPKLKDRTYFWFAVAAEWHLFIYFLILAGNPTPVLRELSYGDSWAVFLSLTIIPMVILFVIPYVVVLLSIRLPNQDFSELHLREMLAAITLFPAALAVIYRVGPLLEVFVLLGLLLYPFSKFLGWKIDIEDRLVHLLTRLDDGERGVALAMAILSGLYLASWAAEHLWIQLTFLRMFLAVPEYSPHFPPFLLALVITVAVGVGSIFWWTRLSFSDWEGGIHSNPLVIASGILVVEGVAFVYLLSFISPSTFDFSLSNPVVFAVAISVYISFITEAKHYRAPMFLITIGKVAGALLFIPAFLNSKIFSVYPIIALPPAVYYLTPIVQDVTRKIAFASQSLYKLFPDNLT